MSRKHLGRPVGLAILCAALVVPAWLLGDEAGRAYRRLLSAAVSRIDWLFHLVANAPNGAAIVQTFEAWGVWMIHGIVAGLVAMLLTRAIAGRAGGLLVIAAVVGAWSLVRLLVWDWDDQHRFALTPFSIGGPSILYGPWPIAPWLGFLAGLAMGLTLASRLVRR